MDNNKRFTSSPSQIKKLRKQISNGYYKKSPLFNWIIFLMAMLFCSALVAMGLHTVVTSDGLTRNYLEALLLFSGIGIILFLIFPFRMIKEYMKRRAMHRRMLENLEKRHGGVDKVLSKIDNLLDSPELVQPYTVTYPKFHIVGDWCIQYHEYKHIVHISEIAAIIGVSGWGRGTYLIYEYDDRTVTHVEFGGEEIWGDVFELFSAVNPDILHSSSLVALPNGNIVATIKAYRKKQYIAIIEAYRNTKSFKESIKPFGWVEHDEGCALLLDVGAYKSEIFETRADEGFEGGGYDWQSLARVFLTEKMPELVETVKFDSEASMFCAYSNKADSLKKFALSFKAAVEDDVLIRDLFSRAELD